MSIFKICKQKFAKILQEIGGNGPTSKGNYENGSRFDGRKKIPVESRVKSLQLGVRTQAFMRHLYELQLSAF